MVVEDLDAVVADGAVRAARRAVELARHAPLHAHGDAVDVHVAVEGRAEVVVAVLVSTRLKKEKNGWLELSSLTSFN